MASAREMSEARRAPDRWDRTRAMADFVRLSEAGGAVTVAALRQEGFTDAEIFGYADDVRAIRAARPGAGEPQVSPARLEGLLLVAEGRRIRARQAGETERAPPAERREAPAPQDVPSPPAGEGGSALGEPPPRRPRQFGSAGAVLQRLHDLCRSVLQDIEDEDLVLVPRGELAMRDRRAAEGDRLRHQLAALLGGSGGVPA